MSSITTKLIKEPKWLNTNLHYEVKMGSHAYGIANPDSDLDIYGWAMPPKGILFPIIDGYVEGLDDNIPTFEQRIYQDDGYDITIYGLTKYMRLVRENNPNMVDSLFVPSYCILHMSPLGGMLRDARHLFLSKKAFHSFRGYAHSQLSKVESRKNSDQYKALEAFEKLHNIPTNLTLEQVKENPNNLVEGMLRRHIMLYEAGLRVTKRFEDVKVKGYDSKFLYHTVRLLLECEQILRDYDLILDNNQEILREVRSGVWTLEQASNWFDRKLKELEELYKESVVPDYPDMDAIKQLFFDIVEEHYGKIPGIIK